MCIRDSTSTGGASGLAVATAEEQAQVAAAVLLHLGASRAEAEDLRAGRRVRRRASKLPLRVPPL
eukprot:5158285-Alexandrium_andersonii.AAC.1